MNFNAAYLLQTSSLPEIQAEVNSTLTSIGAAASAVSAAANSVSQHEAQKYTLAHAKPAVENIPWLDVTGVKIGDYTIYLPLEDGTVVSIPAAKAASGVVSAGTPWFTTQPPASVIESPDTIGVSTCLATVGGGAAINYQWIGQFVNIPTNCFGPVAQHEYLYRMKQVANAQGFAQLATGVTTTTSLAAVTVVLNGQHSLTITKTPGGAVSLSQTITGDSVLYSSNFQNSLDGWDQYPIPGNTSLVCSFGQTPVIGQSNWLGSARVSGSGFIYFSRTNADTSLDPGQSVQISFEFFNGTSSTIYALPGVGNIFSTPYSQLFSAVGQSCQPFQSTTLSFTITNNTPQAQSGIIIGLSTSGSPGIAPVSLGVGSYYIRDVTVQSAVASNQVFPWVTLAPVGYAIPTLPSNGGATPDLSLGICYGAPAGSGSLVGFGFWGVNTNTLLFDALNFTGTCAVCCVAYTSTGAAVSDISYLSFGGTSDKSLL
jgi:hypothetical protein